jgi:hypothetical protein
MPSSQQLQLHSAHASLSGPIRPSSIASNTRSAPYPAPNTSFSGSQREGSVSQRAPSPAPSQFSRAPSRASSQAPSQRAPSNIGSQLSQTGSRALAITFSCILIHNISSQMNLNLNQIPELHDVHRGIQKHRLTHPESPAK